MFCLLVHKPDLFLSYLFLIKIGIWHEQSRMDRDKYVEVLWNNIEKGNTRGRGVYSSKFYTGRLLLRGPTITLLCTILTEKVPLSWIFNWKRYSFHKIS